MYVFVYKYVHMYILTVHTYVRTSVLSSGKCSSAYVRRYVCMYVCVYIHALLLSSVLKLNTALVGVANKLREEGDITMRQLESEKKKSPSKRASGKIELLKKNMTEVLYVHAYVCMYIHKL